LLRFENRPVFITGLNRMDPGGSLKPPEETTQNFVPIHGERGKFKPGLFCFQFRPKRTVEMNPTKF
jgi:hypothetical protein